MKIGRFLALGTLAYGAYYAYKRREGRTPRPQPITRKYLLRFGQYQTQP